MLHYTLNSADTFDCSQKPYDRLALNLLKPLARRALVEGQTAASLPPPLEAYRVEITAVVGAALFDVYGNDIIVTNAVAWTDAGQQECWEAFESLYLRLSQQFGIILGRAPVVPESLPWLATLVLPNPEGSRLTWLADFEQCLALALIREAQAKAKPKGFGKKN